MIFKYKVILLKINMLEGEEETEVRLDKIWKIWQDPISGGKCHLLLLWKI